MIWPFNSNDTGDDKSTEKPEKAADNIRLDVEDEKVGDGEREPVARLEFGAQEWVNALCRRIDEKLENPERQDEPSLVVGLYGEWGSGKSTLLNAIYVNYAQQLDKGGAIPTIPVLFNAWRYEREPHLIIPLLKTAEHRLRSFQAKKALWDVVKTNAHLLSHSIIAIAAGISGKLSLPFVGEVNVDLKKMLAEEKERWQRRGLSGSETVLNQLESTYFNLNEYLQGLTGRRRLSVNGEVANKLNLVFLIDDLDRCLPDKSVEMLEAIKLFLEVPGCAFVLAVDDQVVHRGIDYRYRQYHSDDNSGFEAVANSINEERYDQWKRNQNQLLQRRLITGNEYLEKIIHLPVPVPKPLGFECEVYLRRKFPKLAELEKSAELEPGGIIKLLAEIVPSVPRKLNRVTEMLLLQWDIAQQRQWTDIDLYFLARLVCLQIFAPELYRFGWRERGMFQRLWSWAQTHPNWEATLDVVSAAVNRERDQLHAAEGDERSRARIRTIERLDLPLLNLLRESLVNRSGFDARLIVSMDFSVPSKIHRYYQLKQHQADEPQTEYAEFSATEEVVAEAESDATAVELVTEAPVPQAAPPRMAENRQRNSSATTAAPTPAKSPPAAVEIALYQQPEASLDDAERFFDMLISSSPEDWPLAFEQEAEALAGCLLDKRLFAKLLEVVAQSPQMVSPAWLHFVVPHLSRLQFLELLDTSAALTQYDGVAAEESVDLVQMLCQKINPPWRADPEPIALEKYGLSNWTLLDGTLDQRYLRGLHLLEHYYQGPFSITGADLAYCVIEMDVLVTDCNLLQAELRHNVPSPANNLCASPYERAVFKPNRFDNNSLLQFVDMRYGRLCAGLYPYSFCHFKSALNESDNPVYSERLQDMSSVLEVCVIAEDAWAILRGDNRIELFQAGKTHLLPQQREGIAHLLSPAPYQLLTVDVNGHLRLWDTRSRKSTLDYAIAENVSYLCALDNDRYLLSLMNRLVLIEGAKSPREIEVDSQLNPGSANLIPLQGNLIAVCQTDSRIVIYDVEKNTVLSELQTTHYPYLGGAVGNERWLACDEGGDLTIWDWRKSRKHFTFQRTASGNIRHLFFISEQVLALVFDNGLMVYLDLDGGELQKLCYFTGSAAFPLISIANNRVRYWKEFKHAGFFTQVKNRSVPTEPELEDLILFAQDGHDLQPFYFDDLGVDQNNCVQHACPAGINEYAIEEIAGRLIME